MKVCPDCKSDVIEETSSTAIRVIFCIVILFLPFGIFFCWIPFIFPRKYRCKSCGNEGENSQLVDIDWRDKELIVKDEATLDEKIKPYLNNWFDSNDKQLFKIVTYKGNMLLVVLMEDNVKIYSIIEFSINSSTYKIYLKDNINKGLTSSMLEIFSEEEVLQYENKQTIEEFREWLIEKEKLVDFLNVEVM
ncbi:BRI3 family protein [Alkaliphilus peptidifermentans]|uniref:Uncharacterized protein n=1 Tax=Alkaliphilus peptidifermentans DSM 18978 TaxID=1120976 RepID=A0A1G5D6Q9_9FIRM|nr:hypothetical protein [Alkaliphilus peptidifermentans]SCY10314.1 hypothetical protein SAMN03080606_00814 [Alkaliphilus peptidifermentans DSM 18978]